LIPSILSFLRDHPHVSIAGTGISLLTSPWDFLNPIASLLGIFVVILTILVKTAEYRKVLIHAEKENRISFMGKKILNLFNYFDRKFERLTNFFRKM
jgi:hypothetical protein